MLGWVLLLLGKQILTVDWLNPKIFDKWDIYDIIFSKDLCKLSTIVTTFCPGRTYWRRDSKIHVRF